LKKKIINSMGSWLSSTFSDDSLGDSRLLGDKSQSTIFLMNRILEFILRNADLADMISLATDDGCKKWLIIAESRITELFDKVKIKPEAKDGVLYLKKLNVLEKEASKGGINKVYCKLLAFFFIRLFQIVGALALSVLDTQIPNSNYLESSTLEIPERRGVPFFPKEIEQKKKFWNIFSGGGVLDLSQYLDTNDNLVTFKLLKQGRGGVPQAGIKAIQNMDDITFVQVRGNTKVQFNLSEDNDTLSISKAMRGNKSLTLFRPTATMSIRAGSEYSGQIIVSYEGIDSRGNKQIRSNIDFTEYINDMFEKIRAAPKSDIITILRDYRYLDQVQDDFKIRDTNIYLKRDQLEEDIPSFIYIKKSKVSNNSKDNAKDIKIQFNLLFTRDSSDKAVLELDNIKLKGNTDLYIDTKLDGGKISFKKEIGLGSQVYTTTDPKFNNQSIPQFLEKQMEILYKRVEEAAQYGITKGKDGFVRPLLDVKIKEHPLKYSELWGILSNPPVKSYCTARALQLLNVSGLTRQIPTEVEPLIYETKFPLIKNKSLPEKGKPIIESAPFKALDYLYSAPPTNILEVNQEYVTGQTITLDKLLKSFNLSGMALRDIKEEEGTPVGKIKDPATIKYLRNQATLLLNIQNQHTQKVEILLKKLFIIENNITLNPNILAKGVKGIEEIAVEARDLLTDYFSNCQTEYSKGVKVIKDPNALKPKNLNAQIPRV